MPLNSFFLSTFVPMIYPSNYEQKIGFDEIRRMLKGHCQSTLGQEKVDEIAFSDDASVVNEQMEQVHEMRRLMQATDKPEMNYFFDVRESVARIRLENTHLEENELWDLRRSMETIGIIVTFLNKNEGGAEREGFEPPVPLGTVVFKTTVIDHSTISPVNFLEIGCKGTKNN